LQPLIASAFKDATRAIALVAAAMTGAEFDVAKMRARAAEGWVTLTELADMLARDHGLPFKAGHSIAAALVRGRRDRPDAPLADLVAAASRDIVGREIRLSEDELARTLSPEHFVAVRRTWGGPAPDVAASALATSRALLERDVSEVASLRARLVEADEKRGQALKDL